LLFVAAATPLFLAGVAVGYTMLPKALGLLLGFTPESLTNLPTVDNYLSFVIRMLLVFGIGFLLPVFVVALNFVGVISADNIRNTWRWTIIGVLVFAAVATPTGDPITMSLLAAPILLLMAGAFGIAYLNDRRRARRSTELGYADLDDDEASPIAAPERIDAPAELDLPDDDPGAPAAR
jgi:sec-independent protein translocase protein TatC